MSHSSRICSEPVLVTLCCKPRPISIYCLLADIKCLAGDFSGSGPTKAEQELVATLVGMPTNMGAGFQDLNADGEIRRRARCRG